jgi:hypothetical protein
MEIVWQAEDSLREKKVESDLKDLLKTLVAFANSVAPGDTAQIFVGERDDGTVQGVTNTDSIQKSVKKEAEKIYPGIYYKTEVYERHTLAEPLGYDEARYQNQRHQSSFNNSSSCVRTKFESCSDG